MAMAVMRRADAAGEGLTRVAAVGRQGQRDVCQNSVGKLRLTQAVFTSQHLCYTAFSIHADGGGRTGGGCLQLHRQQ